MFIHISDLPVLFVLLTFSLASIYLKKLSTAAGLTGFLCAMIIYKGAGYTGLLLLAVFFITGTLATSFGSAKKALINAGGDSGGRKAGQVLANGGVATLMAIGMLLLPSASGSLSLMLAASFSSATADTLSSELGMVFGRRFYNCISWRKEQAGPDGVISLEGTLTGLLGAVVIGLLYCCFTPFKAAFPLIVVAGAAGNYLDSVMGATFERRGWLNNDQVNFLSTLAAALIAFFLHLILNRF